MKPPVVTSTLGSYLKPALSEVRQAVHSLKRKPQPGLDENALSHWVTETDKLLSDKAIAELDIFVPVIFGTDDRDEAGEINKKAMTSERRELYRSPNGDCWFLARDPANGKAFVMHEPNQASGGQTSRVEIGAFLRSDAEGPEHQALLRLIGSLVDTSPASASIEPMGSGSIAPGDLNPSNDE